MHELANMTVGIDVTGTASSWVIVVVVIYIAKRVDLRLRIR